MFINRLLQPQIENSLFQGKAIILYGARRVGKTTLVKRILNGHVGSSIYLNCDEPDVRSHLTERTSTELGQLIGDNRLIVIDEAQRVRDIGLTLKLFVDNFPKIQVLATGSSSFELSNRVKEPLTGRKKEFHLFPLSFSELRQIHKTDLELKRLIGTVLIFGLYPEVMSVPLEQKPGNISDIAESYLFRDVLEYRSLKKPELLEKLLQALALQIGNEVSYRELASLLGTDKATVEKYIRLLESAFIIFSLRPLSRNLRKEIGKKRKIYFYDLGIRNSIIRNFNPMDLRSDVGGIWENFLLAERMKANSYGERLVNRYFWRTYDRKEIDLVEEAGGRMSGYEFKWGKGKAKLHREFLAAYPGSSIELVNKDNFLEFVR